MKTQDAPKSKLITAKGVFVRLNPVTGHPDYSDKWINPSGNGFWALHKITGDCLVITMGPKKGMWHLSEMPY